VCMCVCVVCVCVCDCWVSLTAGPEVSAVRRVREYDVLRQPFVRLCALTMCVCMCVCVCNCWVR